MAQLCGTEWVTETADYIVLNSLHIGPGFQIVNH